jgi:prepilin-type N-terminal cleavage/methylation domain-containing protein/prepilin-type processing-associated H-X9-DG protein
MLHSPHSPGNQGRFRALSSGAFTLVELLAAVAVMALLATLAILGVQSAADKSKSARCLSNLRQLGVAINAYAVDNDGWMPAPKDDPYSGGERWVTLVKPYAGEQKGRNSIFLCPAEKNQPPDNITGQWHYLRTDAAVYSGDVPAPQRNLRRRLITLQKPSQTLILVDGTVGTLFPYCTSSSLGWTTATLDLQKSDYTESVNLDFHRHNGFISALFVDGHVSSIPWKDRAVIMQAAWRGYGF